jgi:tetratricopeptide (TPR) repeat protein
MQSLSAEAISAAQARLISDTTNLDALLLLGRAEMARQNFAEAAAIFTRAAKHHPSSQRAHFMLGFALYVENDFRLALDALNEASRLNPRDANTILYRALAHAGLAEPNAAKPLFESAMRLSRDPEIRLAYARLELESGNRTQARTLILQALELAPNSREAHYEMARLKLDSDQAAQAATEAELALQLPGTGVTERQLHFLLTKAYTTLGNPKKAAHHRTAFEAIPPRLIR